MDEKDKNNNKKKEMKQLIENWIASKTYADLKLKLQKKAEEFINIENLNHSKIVGYIEKNSIQKSELERIANSVIEYSLLSDEEKNDLSWISETLSYNKTKEEIIRSLIKQLVIWYSYIYIYQTKEDYELCAKMFKAVDLEKREIISVLRCNLKYEENDDKLIDEIDNIIKTKLLKL